MFDSAFRKRRNWPLSLSDPQKRGHRLVGSKLEMMMAPVVKAFVHAVCSVDLGTPVFSNDPS